MEIEAQQWSEETRQRFAAAVETLAEAVRLHGAAVLGTTGRQAEVPGLFTAGDDLARAASAYTEAQLDFTGTTPRFGVDEPWDDDEDEDPFPDAVGAVLVVRRADYAVTDFDAVLSAGRAAYRRVWPDDTDEDAVADVTGLDRALHQIEHAAGVAALDDVPGLEEMSSSTWILDPADDAGRRAALTAALIEDGGHEWGDNLAE